MREVDPKVFGPGTWCVIHVLAIISEEDGDKQNYIKVIYRILHSLPCAVCRRHAVTYLDKNPIEENKEFEWSVNFHNSVNKRLKKPVVSLADARAMYDNLEILMTHKHTGKTCSLKVPNSDETGGCQDDSL